MSETATETTTSADKQEGEQQAQQTDGKQPDTEQRSDVDYRAEAEKWQALARKHEDRAKSNADKAKAYDDLKRSQMSEQEKAVETARNETRAEMLRETAPRLVSAEFRAVAAGRLSAEQITELLEDLDMTKYLTDTGEVDTERVAKKVDALAPKADGFPDLGQGVRSTRRSADMNQLIRRGAGRA